MSWLPKQRVVVPYDFSEPSAEAVATAVQMVESPSHVEVVFVVVPPHPADPAAIWGAEKERVSRATESLRKNLDDHGYNQVGAHVTMGYPGKEIVAHAKSVGADLIVIPSHGRKGLPRMLLGSVAERVLRLAHCPVLVLRRTED